LPNFRGKTFKSEMTVNTTTNPHHILRFKVQRNLDFSQNSDFRIRISDYDFTHGHSSTLY
jgi:hypothetical protein